ncbi:dihydrolipoyl dehydrogenase [Gudongella oleilytica]|uniref:dihydrolipoyl dehydrogenase n=1 Tax=Gudongella oleilytica TaxID=1582259 RepID=UPI000FF891E9|nr:dihydrolipoyl dehydrogenase [Gudongella oleilytica]
MEKYDIAILGGGPGGYVSAIKAAQMGAKVLLVERERLGGLCLNWGCIPTKTLLISARHYRDLLRSNDFGISGVDLSNARVDWKLLMERKSKVVDKLVSGIELLVKKNKITFINGEGMVLDNHSMEINGEKISFENLIIATGALSNVPEIPGLSKSMEDGHALDSRGILSLQEMPEAVTILGGNVYAVEFATIFNAIGTKVTLIHKNKSILPGADHELSQLLERQLKKDGVKILGESDISRVEGPKVTVNRKDREETIVGDKLIVFMGIQPNLKGLEALDLKMNERGFIKTDPKLRTSIDNIYAVGDVNGTLPLAHVASAEGIVAAETIMGVESRMNYNIIPRVVYSFPELASVGITEEEAKDKGLDYSVGKFPLMANGMAIAEGETNGFVKIISDNKYGEVIGVHMAAATASDMISKAAAVMQLEGTVYDIAKTIHPHPTFAEALMEAAFAVIDKPIHV